MRLTNPFTQFMLRFGAFFTGKGEGEDRETARKTFPALAATFLLDGLYVGFYISYVYYVLKTGIEAEGGAELIGNDLLIALANMCGVIGMLFSFYFAYYFEGRSKRPVLFLAMGFVILGALSFLFVPAGLLFLPAIMLISLSDGVRLPARNAVIQTNFSRRERSSVLGKLMLFSAAAVITGILIGGRILNSNYLLYKGVFPLALMCLFLSNFILANIRSKVKGNATHRKFKLSRPFEPYVHLLQLLREDRFFLMFEVGFFLYGCGFMTMMAMNPIYYYDKFGALPSQFGYTAVIMNVVLFLGPLVGRYADKRSNPMKLAALSFASLAMFPLILYFCPGIMYAYGAHAWFSLGMVGVMMCWNLGPIFFAKNRDASAYIGIHVTLTGLRALLILPLVGFIKENTSTFLPVFILATTLFLCAATVMFFLNRNARTSSKFHTTASGRFETAGS